MAIKMLMKINIVITNVYSRAQKRSAHQECPALVPCSQPICDPIVPQCHTHSLKLPIATSLSLSFRDFRLGVARVDLSSR